MATFESLCRIHEKVYRRYQACGSLARAADHYGVCTQTLTRVLRVHGYPLKTAGGRRGVHILGKDYVVADIVYRYHQQRQPLSHIAAIYGCSNVAVWKALKRAGRPASERGQVHLPQTARGGM